MFCFESLLLADIQIKDQQKQDFVKNMKKVINLKKEEDIDVPQKEHEDIKERNTTGFLS